MAPPYRNLLGDFFHGSVNDKIIFIICRGCFVLVEEIIALSVHNTRYGFSLTNVQ